MDFDPTEFHDYAPPGISAAELAKINAALVEGITKAEAAQLQHISDPYHACEHNSFRGDLRYRRVHRRRNALVGRGSCGDGYGHSSPAPGPAVVMHVLTHRGVQIAAAHRYQRKNR